MTGWRGHISTSKGTARKPRLSNHYFSRIKTSGHQFCVLSAFYARAMKPSTFHLDHALPPLGDALKIKAQLDDCIGIQTRPVGDFARSQTRRTTDKLMTQDEWGTMSSLQRQGSGDLGHPVSEASPSRPKSLSRRKPPWWELVVLDSH